MFKLHVIQAQFGDSLLLEYGTDPSKPKFILIDGGPSKNFEDALRQELERVVGKGGKLEALMVSHIDMDHIKGVLDLLTELRSQKDTGEKSFLKIKEVWLNSFSVVDPENEIQPRMQNLFTLAEAQNMLDTLGGIAIQGVKEGDSVARNCILLNIPLNAKGENGFFMVGAPKANIRFSNLTFTIVGPTKENLKNLKIEWDKWLEKNEKEIMEGTFDIQKMNDKSVPNLSSIMFLVKGNGRTILFTGDGRGDHLIDGLKEKNLLRNEKFHVDVLKVPHHGSFHNTDASFYDVVTADTYILSANGKYDNPDFETLEAIILSAVNSNRKIRLIVTNETDSTKTLIEKFPPEENNYTISFIKKGKFSIEV
jgi:beta-lactamase superfamily II metal-dependent hydrolase